MLTHNARMGFTRPALIVGAFLALAVICTFGTADALAQPAAPPKYDELTIPDGLDIRGKGRAEVSQISARIRELQGEVKKILEGEVPLAGNETKFDGYFTKYLFPKWTWVQKIENSEPNKDGDLLNNFN